MKPSFLLTILGILHLNAQSISVSDIADLPTTLNETSGLIYYNNQLITHNDSGNAAALYEVNPETGAITRTINVTNAINSDWEDIAQDDNYIYIGDIGNNNGNRTDLKIYRILKTAFDSNTEVTADVIYYSYEDQIDFTTSPNNNDWDAEGFVVFESQILIFTKNWVNHETKVYAFPKVPGTYSASLVSTYAINGLVTGADMANSKIYLTGYTSNSITPFLAVVYGMTLTAPDNLDVFEQSNVHKFEGILPFAHQVESICFVENIGTDDKLYISHERLAIGPVLVEAGLKSVLVDTLTLSTNTQTDLAVKVYPNPFSTTIYIGKTVDRITIYNLLGQAVLYATHTNQIDTSHLEMGSYVIRVHNGNEHWQRQLIKH